MRIEACTDVFRGVIGNAFECLLFSYQGVPVLTVTKLEQMIPCAAMERVEVLTVSTSLLLLGVSVCGACESDAGWLIHCGGESGTPALPWGMLEYPIHSARIPDLCKRREGK
jgi:hypothetical protein